jgi:hypothetical protein
MTYDTFSREQMAGLARDRHPSTVSVMKHFASSHLPPGLGQVSAPFGVLALDLIQRIDDCPELTVCLRKLLEAEDCAVRAFLESECE